MPARGLLFIILAGLWPAFCLADDKVAPELSVYWTHNNTFRSRFAGSATWLAANSDFKTAGFEYDLDVGLLSFFRRYVFKDPNAENTKRLTLRLGYAYLPDLTTGDTSVDEKRALGELTIRFPIGQAWLLSDRNRGELRRIGDSESGRYRNRLRLERSFAVKRFRFRPYTSAEAYYDGKVNDWNQTDGVVGAEFPWYYQTILELSFTRQYIRSAEDHRVLGITVQKFL